MKRSEFLVATASLTAIRVLPASVQAVQGGRTYIVPLKSAPYPHASRARGHTYNKKLYDAAHHYSNSNVAIFVPDGWHAVDGNVDFIVHFYGWNHDIASTLKTYRLREQLIASKRNAILIVPEGPANAPDSGFGKLELDDDGFQLFMTDVLAWLQQSAIVPASRIGRVVLTAHSGGYGGAGGALTRGGMNATISDVILFDAAYGYYDAFARWAGDPGHHFLSIFTDDTSTGNTALMGKLQTATPNLFVWLAEDMTAQRLATRAPTFVLATTVAHDDLLQKYSWYAMFLQSTALGTIATS